MNQNTSKAFTLLELLVVITIIGVLSSIVVVSLSGSTDSADIAKIQPFSHQVHALLGHEAVLDLNFNENSFDSCPDLSDVCDASGKGNNGTFYGSTSFVTSQVDGYALSFDGSGDYVEIDPDLLDNACSGTVMLWFKRGEWAAQYSTIFSKSNGGSWNNNHIQIARNSLADALHLTISNNVSSTGANVLSGAIEIDKWYHIAMTWNGSVLKGYQNGVLVDYFNTSICLPSDSTKVVIAKGAAGTERYFNGVIDEVRAYEEALSISEIQKHYVEGLKNLLAQKSVSKEELDRRMEEIIF